jgi:hypothetical protein
MDNYPYGRTAFAPNRRQIIVILPTPAILFPSSIVISKTKKASAFSKRKPFERCQSNGNCLKNHAMRAFFFLLPAAKPAKPMPQTYNHNNQQIHDYYDYLHGNTFPSEITITQYKI